MSVVDIECPEFLVLVIDDVIASNRESPPSAVEPPNCLCSVYAKCLYHLAEYEVAILSGSFVRFEIELNIHRQSLTDRCSAICRDIEWGHDKSAGRRHLGAVNGG